MEVVYDLEAYPEFGPDEFVDLLRHRPWRSAGRSTTLRRSEECWQTPT